MRRLQINFNFSNRAIYTLGIIGFLIIMGCVVYSDWNPSKTTFHPAEDVKINIEGVDYDLQEAVNLGLIGGDSVTNNIYWENITNVPNYVTDVDINNHEQRITNVETNPCPTGYRIFYENGNEANCKLATWGPLSCTCWEYSYYGWRTAKFNYYVTGEARLSGGKLESRITSCSRQAPDYGNKCTAPWTEGDASCTMANSWALYCKVNVDNNGATIEMRDSPTGSVLCSCRVDA